MGDRAKSKGILKYRADLVSIAWVQATLAFTLLPWFVNAPLWARALMGVPVFFFRSSCAYIHHNQGHLSVFWNKTLNFIYDIELALLSGYVTPLWELQHARGHHRHYLEWENDPASIIDRRTGQTMPRWKYCLRGNLTIIPDSWRIAGEEARRGRADARPRMVAQFLIAGMLSLTLCYLNWVNFVAFILVPNVLIGWFVWHISYDHHDGVPGNDHYDGSNTHLGREFNWLRFNIGYHAAHHEKPTLHWSLLPRRTEEILARLDPVTVHGSLPAERTSLSA